MPKSTSKSKLKVRPHPLTSTSRNKNNISGKRKAQVSVVYEDGSGGLTKTKANGKGKGKAVEEIHAPKTAKVTADDSISSGSDVEAENEDIKPDLPDAQLSEILNYKKSAAAAGGAGAKVAPEASTSKSIAASSVADGAASFILIAGSYEKNLYGIEGTFSASSSPSSNSQSELELKLAPAFIFPAHLSCIKSLASSKGGKWLVSGGEDEYVKVWDLRRRKEVGSLGVHGG